MPCRANTDKIFCSMTTKLQLVGSYFQIGQDLISQNSEQGFKLVISARKTATDNKPKLFLIAKPIKGHISSFKDSYRYISSLYPLTELSSYNIEYDGIRYLLKASDDKVIISSGSATKSKRV